MLLPGVVVNFPIRSKNGGLTWKIFVNQAAPLHGVLILVLPVQFDRRSSLDLLRWRPDSSGGYCSGKRISIINAYRP